MVVANYNYQESYFIGQKYQQVIKGDKLVMELVK